MCQVVKLSLISWRLCWWTHWSWTSCQLWRTNFSMDRKWILLVWLLWKLMWNHMWTVVLVVCRFNEDGESCPHELLLLLMVWRIMEVHIVPSFNAMNSIWALSFSWTLVVVETVCEQHLEHWSQACKVNFSVRSVAEWWRPGIFPSSLNRSG